MGEVNDLKRISLSILIITVLLGAVLIAPAFAKPDSPGPPDIQQKIFIHYAKGAKPKPPSEETGYYKLIGAKWKTTQFL